MVLTHQVRRVHTRSDVYIHVAEEWVLSGEVSLWASMLHTLVH